MNYIQKIKEELNNKLKMGEKYKDLLDVYALLVLVKGTKCTNEDVHDAWSVWCNLREPTHRSLIPFDKLTKEVQDLDSKYRDEIISVARVMK